MVFKGIPLNVLQLEWLVVCSSNGLVEPKELVRSFHSVVSGFFFLLLFSFIFGRRIPHPSLVLLYSINIFICCFLSKNKSHD